MRSFCFILFIGALLISNGESAEIFTSMDLRKDFDGYTACVVFYDSIQDTTQVYNRPLAETRLSPCSTFKILHSLIALDTGVIADPSRVIPWDGVDRGIPAWNRDHSMISAFQNSVVWFYQRIARQIGAERMQKHLDAIGYGNRDISSSPDRFWLGGSLKISPFEQIAFLRRLYSEQLPFSKESIEKVKEWMRIPNPEIDGILRGKTGSGSDANHHWGWFVGYVEQGESIFFFASYIEHPSNATGSQAKTITENILKRTFPANSKE